MTMPRLAIVLSCLAALAGEAATPLPPPQATLVIRNARIFDGSNPNLLTGRDLLIDAGKIIALQPAGALPAGSETTVIDAGGRVLVPGLIDAHVHPAQPIPRAQLRDSDPSYVTLRAAEELRRMLMRGFTTIRDMGGPSFGLKQAIDEGLIPGPRIFPSGAIISQTGGHGDMRERIATPAVALGGPADPLQLLGYSLIVDGPAQVAAAVREQLRLGATQIKLTAGGGISSQYDPLDSVQFSAAELEAAVQSAGDWGTYVAVHAYTPAAIRRAVQAGVRCIEHGHLIDEPTMRLLAERGVFLSPQAYLFSGAFAPPRRGSGPPSAAQLAQRAKSQQVSAGLDTMMQLAKRYKVRIAFGTDVFGAASVYELQSHEFAARSRWFTPVEILHQATASNGELLDWSGQRNPYGKLGVIEVGALADLLIVDGEPLEDIAVFDDPERSLRVIIKNGAIVKNTL
ncbi:MAG: amidohydrolase family protein [Steroidobacteraceae bacterium]